MKVSIVIPNFNGERILKENLPKLLPVIGNSEVIVVDDASTDGSIVALKKYFPQVKIVAREKNEGFSSAVNDGVKIAAGDLVLLLNTDVVPTPGFLDAAIRHFKNSKVFAVGCMQKNVEGDKIVWRGRGIGNFSQGFLIHQRGEIDKTNTLWVSGGAGIFRKNIWHDLGGMDELYNPFYWEDIDLSYRALKAGYKLVFEPESIVIHNQAQGAIRSFYDQAKINTIAYRNQTQFVWLNITDVSLLVNHALFLPVSLIRALIKGDFAFLAGFFNVFIRLPRIIGKRNINKKNFIIQDKEIFAGNKA